MTDRLGQTGAVPYEFYRRSSAPSVWP